MSITEVKFKILGCFRTSLLKYSINNFFSTLKDEVSISKQCSYFHAKNEIFLSTRKSLFIKYVSQFCKLHRTLNFPNIFRLAAIYTRTPAFKICILHIEFIIKNGIKITCELKNSKYFYVKLPA